MKRILIYIFVMTIFTGLAQAQTDTTFTYQGELNESGNPANGSYNVDFALWDALSGGSQVGSTIQFNSLPVTDGLITVELNYGASVFDGSQLWLEITVDGDELIPRQPLTGSPYSIQTRGIFVDDAGNVGIGTTNPFWEFEVANPAPGDGVESGVTAEDAAGAIAAYSSTLPPPFDHFGGRVSLFGNAMDVRADSVTGDMRFYTGGPLPANERMRITEDGKVGIGTTSPERKLHVHSASDNGAIYAVHTAEYNDYAAIKGVHDVNDYYGIGIQGIGGYIGVQGNVSPTGTADYFGVWGKVSGGSGTNRGVYGYASGGDGFNYGVYGAAQGGYRDYGVYGYSDGDPFDMGVYCDGHCTVTGTLFKSAGSFKIDHPLDPANKYLSHSFVESPDMMNIYNGNVITDAAGYAIIEMPEWFDALNADFRYQLTVIGQFAQAIVAEEIRDNTFVIQTNKPHVKVSWQVTGIRIDAYAEAYRIPVEEYKPAHERGLYEHPELFGQPGEKGINYINSPEAREMK